MGASTFDELRLSFIELKKTISGVYCDNDPSKLYPQIADNHLRSLCVRLTDIADRLREHERNAEKGFIAPVEEVFIAAWNDYQKRWSSAVWEVSFYDKNPSFANFVREEFGDVGFLNLDVDYSEKAIADREAMQFRFFMRDLKRCIDELDVDSDRYEFTCDLATTLVRLWKATRFTLEGADERAHLAPIALVPRKVANKVAPAAVRSLYDLWGEARKAYILGAPMASMAMSRAVLEELLATAYRIKKDTLSQSIAAVEKSRIDTRRMDKIRRIGNAVLHGLTNPVSLDGNKAIKNPTQEALKVLVDLKELIEEP